MARFTYRLPDIGEGIAEAEIVAWHVKVGDRVEEDAQIADMMTDKATVEMEAPVAGTILEIAGEVGDVIAIGSALVVIETEGEAEEAPPSEGELEAENPGVETATGESKKEPSPPSGGASETGIPGEGRSSDAGSERGAEQSEASVELPAATQPPTRSSRAKSRDVGEGGERISTSLATSGEGGSAQTHRVLTTPAVRARAKDLGVDLSQVKSQSDRIRHADLDAYLSYGSSKGYRPAGASAARPDEQVKVVGLRRRIAENMAASKRAIPHFTYVEEIDVTALEDMRADLNANRGGNPKLTMLPLLIVAICKALTDFPMINARYDDEAGVVTRHGSVHLGMATQTDAGLMVPVIRDAQDRNVWQLATEITRLADAARAGKAKSEELSGSTLTVTSLGPLGGIATTPVINRPEVAIIGPNRIVERPVIRDGEIVAAKLMNLSISCDHRVVDGWDAASYVQALRKLLETPVLLFVE